MEEYMRIKHRFGFSRDKDIYNCLDKIGMPYEKGDLVSILTIFEDDRRFEQVKALFLKEKKLNRGLQYEPIQLA